MAISTRHFYDVHFVFLPFHILKNNDLQQPLDRIGPTRHQIGTTRLVTTRVKLGLILFIGSNCRQGIVFKKMKSQENEVQLSLSREFYRMHNFNGPGT